MYITNRLAINSEKNQQEIICANHGDLGDASQTKTSPSHQKMCCHVSRVPERN